MLDQLKTSGKLIIAKLSFSHIVEIMAVDDSLARYFYEQECIKCTWSVRELRRQISTNLYVRAGISSNPEKMLSLPGMKGHDSNELQIREPFTFEFLGLRAQEVVTEQDIEDALITHLQEFILELGKGFCFESRQKRIVIDDEYYYPDLVFYNRYLHCSVILELKDSEFSHENLGQLNAYVSYYRENEMQPGTILQLVFCSVRERVRKWWSMHWLEWIASSSSLPTCFNCQIRKLLKTFC